MSARELSRPIKVLFLDPKLHVGGVERLTQTLFRNMDRSRFDPVVCGLFGSGAAAEEFGKGLGLRVRHSLGRGKWDPLLLFRFLRMLREEKPDVILTCIYPLTMFLSALARLCGHKFRVVASVHSTGYIKRAAWRSFSTRASIPLLDSVVTIARAQSEVCVRKLGIPEGKIRLIYNGVELSRFDPDTVRGAVRAEFGIPEQAELAGIVGMLRPEKAHPVLLKAAAAIRKSGEQVRFLIVGDGPEREKLEDMARDLGLAGTVTFTGGRDDIPEVLSALDLFVLCSDTEAFPVSILEAMAMRKPVISTDVGSVSEAVEHGATGLLVPPGDPESLAEAVRALVSSPDLRAQMGRAGRRRVEERFSVEAMVGQYEDLFAQVAGHRG